MRADAGRGGRGGVRGGRRPKGRGEFATGRARAGRQTRPVELRRARSCGARGAALRPSLASVKLVD